MKLMGFSNGTKLHKVVDSFFKGLGNGLNWIDSINQVTEIMTVEENGLLFMLISAEDNSEESLEVSRQLAQALPNLAIVLILEDSNLDIRKAMRSGIFDVLTVPLNQYQVMETITEAEKNLSFQGLNLTKPNKEVHTTKNARVITVCSTKGGVGKTTFTVNLAAAFAKQCKKVAVIDLDLQFGDISMFFDCNPKKTIYEWIKVGRKDSQENIQAYMHSYNEYIDIMPAPIRPEFSEAILEEHISELLTILQPFYDLVIVDTAPYMEDKILMALEKSNDIFLITYLDLPTLKNCKIFIETLDSLSLADKVKVIINRDSKYKGLSSSTAESVLGLPIFLKIPDVEKIVAVSVNEGNPYVYSNPRAKISKMIYSLAVDLTGGPKKTPKKFLFWEKATREGRPV